MNDLLFVFKEHKSNWKNIGSMALKDLKKQYSGTVLGYTWSIIKDMIFIFAYWFTIQIGLKGSANVGYPYMAWLSVGLAAWFFIRDTFAPCSKSIRQNRYLVTKMSYPISTIPTFKIFSSYIASLMFMSVIVCVLLLSGIKMNIYWIQILYYQMAAIILMIGISLFTSALVVVSRDIEMFINSIVFLLFWFTPILFPIKNLSGKLSIIVKLNPFYYIVDGYRASFIYKQWFWERPVLTLYYWAVVIIMLFLGAKVHNKLRSQFVDIL